MMKLKKFNLFEKREGFDDIDDYHYHDDDDSNWTEEDNDDIELSENDDDIRNELCHLFREMFKNIGIDDATVESDNLDISISIRFNRKEQLRDVLKVFGIIKKIKRDILAQYEDSFEMWETKTGETYITFYFVYEDESYRKSSKYKNVDDSYPW